jgi:hypothetical protein
VTHGVAASKNYERIRRDELPDLEKILGVDNNCEEDGEVTTALVLFAGEQKEIEIIDRRKEKYLKRVNEVMQEHMNLELKAKKERPFSSANLAIKQYQNKASIELGTSKSPQKGFFITNPEHDISVMQMPAIMPE